MADPLFKATLAFRHVPEPQKCARCGKPCEYVWLEDGGVSWRCCGVRTSPLGPDDDPGDYNDGRFDDPGVSPAGFRVP